MEHAIQNADVLTELRARRSKSLSSLAAEELERMIVNGELQAVYPK